MAPFEGNGVSTIVLDLHDLIFIDSTGVHAFLEARNRAMSNGQRLLVRGTSPTAQRHIETVGLQYLLDDPEHARLGVARMGRADRSCRATENDLGHAFSLSDACTRSFLGKRRA